MALYCLLYSIICHPLYKMTHTPFTNSSSLDWQRSARGESAILTNIHHLSLKDTDSFSFQITQLLTCFIANYIINSNLKVAKPLPQMPRSA